MDFLTFNQNPRSGLAADKLKWFQSRQFRQAVAYAIDRQAIAKEVYAGHAVPQYSPVSPADKFFFNPRVAQYPYTPGKATAMLTEAGFKRGGDGVLRDSDGHPVQFTISTNADDPDRVATATIIREDLARLGMQVTIAREAFNSLVNALTTSHRWDAVLLGLTGSVDPYGAQNVWGSSGALHFWSPAQAQPATRWEAQIDRYLLLAATSSDQNRRRDYYNQFQAIVAEEVPVIYTVVPERFWAVRDRLENLQVAAFGGPFWNFPVIYIKP